VLSLEGNDCFGPGKIDELADTYVSNHGDRDKTKSTANVGQMIGSTGERSPRTERRQGYFERGPADDWEFRSNRDVTYYPCNEKGHISRFRPQHEAKDVTCYRSNEKGHILGFVPYRKPKI